MSCIQVVTQGSLGSASFDLVVEGRYPVAGVAVVAVVEFLVAVAVMAVFASHSVAVVAVAVQELAANEDYFASLFPCRRKT